MYTKMRPANGKVPKIVVTGETLKGKTKQKKSFWKISQPTTADNTNTDMTDMHIIDLFVRFLLP